MDIGTVAFVLIFISVFFGFALYQAVSFGEDARQKNLNVFVWALIGFASGLILGLLSFLARGALNAAHGSALSRFEKIAENNDIKTVRPRREIRRALRFLGYSLIPFSFWGVFILIIFIPLTVAGMSESGTIGTIVLVLVPIVVLFIDYYLLNRWAVSWCCSECNNKQENYRNEKLEPQNCLSCGVVLSSWGSE